VNGWVIIGRVRPDTFASRGGLKVGDRVYLDDPNEPSRKLYARLLEHIKQRPFTLKISRGSEIAGWMHDAIKSANDAVIERANKAKAASANDSSANANVENNPNIINDNADTDNKTKTNANANANANVDTDNK